MKTRSSQRNHVFVWFCALFLFVDVAPLLSSQTIQPLTKIKSNKVATFFFYWYDVYSGFHFRYPDKSDALTDHPPKDYLFNYSFTDLDWHRRELLDMIAAKIDFVLPVYWGNERELFWSQTGLKNLVKAVQSLIKEKYHPPKVGMFYDTTALQYQNAGVPPDLTTLAGKKLFYGMISDFFKCVPKNLWAKINGRPIIYLYYSSYAANHDQKSFNYVYSHFRKEFGVKPFIVKESSWINATTDGEYTWGAALNGPVVFGQIGNLGPGYDDKTVQNRKRSFRKRECGNFYDFSWDRIQNSGAKLVTIETWNEWHEATDIAPSQEYGLEYMNMTADNVIRWKNTDYTKETHVWLDFGTYTLSRGLSPAGNAPDGAWRTRVLDGREAAFPTIDAQEPSYYIYLDVCNDFIYSRKKEVWITVEYFDKGHDVWCIDYDGVEYSYSSTPDVYLQDSKQWKQHTFHLTDAYFGGRQNFGADLRLSNRYDGKTNYFGRVWVSKVPPANIPPELRRLKYKTLKSGAVRELTVSASDPEGHSITLSLEKEVPFVSLLDYGNGSGLLRIAPEKEHVRSCPYWVLVVATDSGQPSLSDAVPLRLKVKN